MEIGCIGCLIVLMLIGILTPILAPLGIYLGITQGRARDRGWGYVRDGEGDFDGIEHCIRRLKGSKDPEDQNLVNRLIELREDLIVRGAQDDEQSP